METGATPPVGDIEEVFQEDPPALFPVALVGVRVEGPVEVHELPSVSGGMRSFPLLLADNLVKRVGGNDPRRRIMRIISDQGFYVGVDMNSVATNYAAQWPANSVCTITHQEEIFVRIKADGFISVITENWAS